MADGPKEFKMPRVVWEPRYRVDVQEIDSQHQRLFALLNSLNTAIEKGEGAEILTSALHVLLDYTQRHFGAEELYMKTYDYPEFEAHRRLHERMTDKVHASQKEYEGGNVLFLCADLSRFVEDWIKNHILKTDQKLAPYLRMKGVM